MFLVFTLSLLLLKEFVFNDLMDFFKSSFYIAVTGFS